MDHMNEGRHSATLHNFLTEYSISFYENLSIENDEETTNINCYQRDKSKNTRNSKLSSIIK